MNFSNEIETRLKKQNIKKVKLIIPLPKINIRKNMSLDFKNTLVITPHLDDETIALGGTIKKLSKAKNQVFIPFPDIVGGHLPPLYNKEEYQITKKESSQKSFKK